MAKCLFKSCKQLWGKLRWDWTWHARDGYTNIQDPVWFFLHSRADSCHQLLARSDSTHFPRDWLEGRDVGDRIGAALCILASLRCAKISWWYASVFSIYCDEPSMRILTWEIVSYGENAIFLSITLFCWFFVFFCLLCLSGAHFIQRLDFLDQISNLKKKIVSCDFSILVSY